MSRVTAVAAVGLASFLIFAAPAAASAPTISYSVEGIAGTNGWYRGSIYGDNVVLHWSVVGATSPTCPPVVIPGPTTGTTETCTASNGPDQLDPEDDRQDRQHPADRHREPLAQARFPRLVQPSRHDPLERNRHHLRPRRLLLGDVQGPRERGRNGQRRMHRRGGQQRRSPGSGSRTTPPRRC